MSLIHNIKNCMNCKAERLRTDVMGNAKGVMDSLVALFRLAMT